MATNRDADGKLVGAPDLTTQRFFVPGFAAGGAWRVDDVAGDIAADVHPRDGVHADGADVPGGAEFEEDAGAGARHHVDVRGPEIRL